MARTQLGNDNSVHGETSSSDSSDINQKLLEDYEKFLSDCNHVDAVDVLSLFLGALIKGKLQDDVGSELLADLAALKIEVQGCAIDPLQVCVLCNSYD